MTTPYRVVVSKLAEALCRARWGDTAALEYPEVRTAWERVATSLLNETITAEPGAIYQAYWGDVPLDYQQLTPTARIGWEACALTATGWVVIPF